METSHNDINNNNNSLIFAVNGHKFELSNFDPCTTLLEFLRSQTRFKSVKLSCGEGGCGACVVLLSKYDPVLHRVEDLTISSCLTLLCSVNGCSVTTSEGLGNLKNGFHPIHERFIGFHASQCGFCTPGMCVSLYGAMVNAEKTDRPDPKPGFSKLTVSEAEKSILGNLCRCTGYRPIADACKSFAADVDIEDLGFNSFWSRGEGRDVKLSRMPAYHRNHGVCEFPDFLINEIRSSKYLNCKNSLWYYPVSLEELQDLLEKTTVDNESRTKILVGNTAVGYYKEYERHERYIDLRNISELSLIRMDHTGVEFGAAVTISKAIEALRSKSEDKIGSDYSIICTKVADHFEKIASGFIRNSASIGGNLMMAQRKGFPSDIVTILLAANATVEIMIGPKREKITLEEFLERPPLDLRSVLLSVKVPNFIVSSQENSKLLFETYRASPRPLGNALPHLNAAFLAGIHLVKDSNKVIVNYCQLSFGAFGNKHAIRAKKVEEFLGGKMLSFDVLHEAIELLRVIIIPEAGTANPTYRTSLAAGFLFEFFGSLIDSNPAILDGMVNRSPIDPLHKSIQTNQNNERNEHVNIPTLLSSANQVLEINTRYHPVGEPVTKSLAAIQASGEAVYVDDIPSPSDCLHGAFIYSRMPFARIRSIGLNPEPQPEGVVAVVTYKDIPEGGTNVGAKTIFGSEPLFADEFTQCAGQRLAVVVADTQKRADMAANFAIVDYDTENLDPPILSVEEAVKRSSYFEVPTFFNPKAVGDITKGMAEADHKILAGEIKLGSQYYFYMETQTALAIPDEDNCLVVYSSIQCPEFAHSTIAKCLGIPEHNVRVISRRVGGGFGGKAIKAMPVATSCALAAYKFQRPVRIYLNRKVDMIMAGGRHPMKVTYSVGFKSNGKITALQLDILINAGMSEDISPMMPNNIMGSLKKYDWGSLSFDIKVCKTNLVSKSAMRAPGEVQGSYIAEVVIENVASSLSRDVDSVRRLNLHTCDSLYRFYEISAGEPHEYTLVTIWDKLDMSSSLRQRTEMIKQFNSFNLWRKRGISRVPIVHEVCVRPTRGKVSILPDGSIVVEVGGIELGQGLWTKVKQMAAYALSLIQCDGVANLLEKVRVVQADTLSLTQGGFTAGSTTSESSCEAVRQCCNILVDRLAPLKERLQEQSGSVKWEMLILQAYLQAVNLSASTYYVPDLMSMKYINYGAAVSEVEINLITGGTTILRADIIYDCGQSLNPAVDLGQIEGAFVQGIGFFMMEEYTTNSDGLVIVDGTWSYKIPTMDTIPKQFNVEILNSGQHEKRVLSSKASGEPPLLLAASVHCATRAAIKEARKQLLSWMSSISSELTFSDKSDLTFQLEVPATMPVVKELCGLDNVDAYLKWRITKQ